MDGMLSQEEINALFSDISEDESVEDVSSEELLTEEEKDAIGEISNISLGSSATTLFTLVNQRVNISTPTVSVCEWAELSNNYPRPCVFVQISYQEGLDGKNILILQEKDVKIIADLMMGGDGSNISDPLNDLHLSAISEAMNQMMGASSTSLSSMFEMKIDISPPSASLIDLNNAVESDIQEFLSHKFVKVSFRMEIGNLIDSELMQLYPIEFAKSLYNKFINEEAPASTPAPAAAPAAPAAAAPQPAPTQTAPQPAPVPQQAAAPMQDLNTMAVGQMPMQGMMQPQMAMPYMMPPVQDVNIAPAQFQVFQPIQSPLLQTENIDLLLDVPLEVTVELGRTSKSIKEILDFAPGTIVELNRLAGEPIDILVNGKYVAKGEVVVIEEAFAIRVSEVIK
ncbi:MAG: flagellar motor switch phosphatase FliY [Lachnospiraceae bacterium]|nr:flagellar motor switch phosphatase FliY [Lachnospiraceae bacterium]